MGCVNDDPGAVGEGAVDRGELGGFEAPDERVHEEVLGEFAAVVEGEGADVGVDFVEGGEFHGGGGQACGGFSVREVCRWGGGEGLTVVFGALEDDTSFGFVVFDGVSQNR